ncbi:MAG: hypothetical protein N4A76_16235 [Firmicutes bacterium]|nr:hypothetical protein [Alphaproteobacteria bacterium]MCT4634259.1 hypothetical protein [Bacillota bacterium]
MSSNRDVLILKANGFTCYEAYINYTSGFEASDRLHYSSDGLIYPDKIGGGKCK